MPDISNGHDILNSTDIIERIEELKQEREDSESDTESDWDEDSAKELESLEAFASGLEGYGDWEYGETLIRESYFTEYCQEMLKDCGDLPKELPNYIVIDWEATANNLRVDYTESELDGVTYFMRC